jgi:hypothetical protein
MKVWSMQCTYAKKKGGFVKPIEYVTITVSITGLFRNYNYFTEQRKYVKEIILKAIQLFALRNCITYVRREADSYI